MLCVNGFPLPCWCCKSEEWEKRRQLYVPMTFDELQQAFNEKFGKIGDSAVDNLIDAMVGI